MTAPDVREYADELLALDRAGYATDIATVLRGPGERVTAISAHRRQGRVRVRHDLLEHNSGWTCTTTSRVAGTVGRDRLGVVIAVTPPGQTFPTVLGAIAGTVSTTGDQQ